MNPPRAAAAIAPLLLFAGILPLLPRPTTGIVGVALVSATCIGLVYAFAVCCARAVPDLLVRRVINGLVVAIVVLAAGHLLKILVSQDWSELPYLAGRTLALSVSFVVFVWTRVSGVLPSQVFRAFTIGYLVLAVLILVVGVTGMEVFEPVRPSRAIVVQIPFYKTAGIPRSFGELSILACVAWAYLLAQRPSMNARIWYLTSALVVLSVFVAQSRTGILAWLVVTGAYLILTRTTSIGVRRLLLGLALSVPVLYDAALSQFRSFSVVTALVGEQTFEENVYVRADLNNTAFQAILQSSLFEGLFGTERASWLSASQEVVGQPTELHNHLIAAILFGGLLFGAGFLFLAYLVPLWRLVSSVSTDGDELLLLLAGTGTIFSLQFYEGFFSLTVALVVGLLWSATFGVSREASDCSKPTSVATGANPGGDSARWRRAAVATPQP